MTSHHPNSHNSFWSDVKSKTKECWNKLLPNNPPEMGREALADTLDGLLKFLPITIRWNHLEITASLDNGETAGDLESGGILPTGNLTLYLSKSAIPEDKYPEPHETIELLQLHQWKTFSIMSVSEPFDQADPAIIIIVEPDNA